MIGQQKGVPLSHTITRRKRKYRPLSTPTHAAGLSPPSTPPSFRLYGEVWEASGPLQNEAPQGVGLQGLNKPLPAGVSSSAAICELCLLPGWTVPALWLIAAPSLATWSANRHPGTGWRHVMLKRMQSQRPQMRLPRGVGSLEMLRVSTIRDHP